MQTRWRPGKTRAQTESPFFSLPPELREMIYEATFDESEVYIRFIQWEHLGPRSRPIPSNVLLACKQAYNEAIEVYYRNRTFEFPGFEQAVEWLGVDIPKANARLVNKVSIWIDRSRIDNEVGKDVDSRGASRSYAAELAEEVAECGVVLKNLDVTLKVWS